MENSDRFSPWLGKPQPYFSNLWKNRPPLFPTLGSLPSGCSGDLRSPTAATGRRYSFGQRVATNLKREDANKILIRDARQPVGTARRAVRQTP
ncbi:MAG: hypothetical protein NTY53_06725, partial [Kiritimatiellaeota bacterium]|nr:hypothetical protein [Kiritimatiellota bacterium]